MQGKNRKLGEVEFLSTRAFVIPAVDGSESNLQHNQSTHKKMTK